MFGVNGMNFRKVPGLEPGTFHLVDLEALHERVRKSLELDKPTMFIEPENYPDPFSRDSITFKVRYEFDPKIISPNILWGFTGPCIEPAKRRRKPYRLKVPAFERRRRRRSILLTVRVCFRRYQKSKENHG